MQPLFENKKGLITGVFNKQSIAWAIAERILEEGGTCGFSYMPDKPEDERKKNLGRVTKLTEGNPRAAFLYPMDVTNDEHIAELMEWHAMRKHVPVLRAVKIKLKELHSSELFMGLNGTAIPSIDEVDEQIQRVINGMATRMRERNQGGCHYIQAINEYVTDRYKGK